MDRNVDYLRATCLIVAGAVLVGSGVAAPIGMGLMVAGADAAIQRMTTGGVDWKQVAVSGVVTAATGGVGTAFGVVGKQVISAGVNGIGNTATYMMQNSDNLTPRGFAAAFAGGAISGAVGGFAGKLGGKVAAKVGLSETGFAARRAADAINFGGGFGGNVTTSAVAGEPVDPVKASVAGTTNVAAGHLSDAVTPRTMFKQPWFRPKEGAPTNPLYTETPKGSRWELTEKEKLRSERLEDAGNAALANATGNASEWGIDKGVDKVRDGNS